MRNRTVTTTLTVFILFIVSCTAGNKNKPAEKSPYGKEKKATTASSKKSGKTSSAKKRVNEVMEYARKNGLSTKYCFLVDMSLPSGRNRFFVYDLEKSTVLYSGLVAHGSCYETFLSQPRFSNANGSGCSSLGKYKIGAFYRGQWGKSYRLYGLDHTNSNAFKRAVVIHGHDCVPDKEIYPRVLCNSYGCPMVSNKFFDRLSRTIGQSEKPIVLWVYR